MQSQNVQKESPFNIATEKVTESLIHKAAPWELRLQPTQLLVMWATIAGCLVLSFLFGYYAGRAEGIEVSLREVDSSASAVRMPIVRPIIADSNSNKLVAKSDVQAAQNITKESENPSSANNAKQAEAKISTQEFSNKFFIGSKLPVGWYVQLNAVRTEQDARAYLSKNNTSDSPLVVESAQTGSLKYFRILSGPYKSEADARSKQGEFEKKGLGQGKAFVRKVS